ncbi:hydrophobin-domain-containing protein [Fistulina hepatica ATCC 64428]|uniref:Hydrophobin n=1 Tax=Fistulina hepatica ATCC 64428 TaxID=1128425 RepID=A0A0D7A486_9AGAR|nr:hydrophobin-domain-containing protein [Fistulina hepatica ATCC 64428]
MFPRVSTFVISIYITALFAVFASAGVVPPDCTTTSSTSTKPTGTTVTVTYPSTTTTIVTTTKSATTTVTVSSPGSTTTSIPASSCSTGDEQCCNSLVSSDSASGSLLLGLLGIVLGPIEAILGIGCSPISVLSGGSAGCSGEVVCCEDNSFVRILRFF